MRVLFLCPWLPWPLNSGGKIRTFHLIRCAAAHCELSLRAVLEPGQTQEMVEQVAPHVADLRVFERGKPGPLRRIARPKLERWFYSPGLTASAREELDQGRYDVVHVDELLLARTPPLGSRVPALQHHHKLDTELYARTTAHKGPQRHFDLWKLHRLERESARRTTRHLACSEGDAEILTQRYPGLRVDVLPSGYDPAYFHPPQPALERDPDHIVYVGSMDYEPNVDAAVRFVREVLPALRAKRPELRFTLVGRSPAPEVRALAGPGVEVTGEVDDVRPYLASAGACVVPLRIGGGTRLKIAEALGMGTPVVSTTIGAEGLELVHDEHLLLADGYEEFARATLQLLDDPRRAEALARAGRAHVEERFGWERLGAQLYQLWSRLREEARS